MPRILQFLNTSYKIEDLDGWRRSFANAHSCLTKYPSYLPGMALHVKQMALARQTQILIDDERRRCE